MGGVHKSRNISVFQFELHVLQFELFELKGSCEILSDLSMGGATKSMRSLLAAKWIVKAEF